jgi:1,4-alpha-glucan branching enzyme
MKKQCLGILTALFIFSFISCGGTYKVTHKKGPNYPGITNNAVSFSLYAPEASLVTIAGTFNGWNPYSTKMMKDSQGTWHTKLSLLKNIHYEYKYIVDGYWISDPENPDTVPDGNGWVNSVFVWK